MKDNCGICIHIYFQLEQMELEVRDLSHKDKQKYQTRLKSYKTELNKLDKDLVRILFTYYFILSACYSII